MARAAPRTVSGDFSLPISVYISGGGKVDTGGGSDPEGPEELGDGNGGRITGSSGCKAGVLVVARTGFPVADSSVGCEAPPEDEGGPKGSA